MIFHWPIPTEEEFEEVVNEYGLDRSDPYYISIVKL